MLPKGLLLVVALLLLSFTPPAQSAHVRTARILDQVPPWRPRVLPYLQHMRKPRKNSKTPRRPQRNECPALLPTSRIVGGVESSPLAPYLAGLFIPFGNGPNAELFFTCTGVLISPRWVVTAAHCGISKGFVVVLGGEKASAGTRVPVARVLAPQQNGPKKLPFNRDIAFVKLTKPAPKTMKFARINTFASVPRTGVGARVAGYGLTKYPKNPSQAKYDEILREVDVPVLSKQECQKQYEAADFPVEITDNRFCAGTRGCGPCRGDSGGPLLQFDSEGRPVLIGIVSVSVRCADTFPTVFTRVSSFLPYMKKIDVEFTRATRAVQVGREKVSPSPSPSPLRPSAPSNNSGESRPPPTTSGGSPPPNTKPTVSPSPKPPSAAASSAESASKRGEVEGVGNGNKALYALAGVGGVGVVALLVGGAFVWRRRAGSQLWESFPSLQF